MSLRMKMGWFISKNPWNFKSMFLGLVCFQSGCLNVDVFLFTKGVNVIIFGKNKIKIKSTSWSMQLICLCICDICVYPRLLAKQFMKGSASLLCKMALLFVALLTKKWSNGLIVRSKSSLRLILNTTTFSYVKSWCNCWNLVRLCPNITSRLDCSDISSTNMMLFGFKLFVMVRFVVLSYH